MIWAAETKSVNNLISDRAWTVAEDKRVPRFDLFRSMCCSLFVQVDACPQPKWDGLQFNVLWRFNQNMTRTTTLNNVRGGKVVMNV